MDPDGSHVRRLTNHPAFDKTTPSFHPTARRRRRFPPLRRRHQGQVSEHKTYGDVTIAFDANFDTNVVTIGRSTVTLDHINTVIIDDVDGDWRVSATRWTEPRLPLVGDWNLALARRSNELLRYLRCDILMPDASPSYAVPQLPVITVCEKLK